MKTRIWALIPAAFCATLFVAGSASAQAYYPTGSCGQITQVLSVGATDQTSGGQVSSLQRKLISHGDLGASTPLGYFGSATTQAVKKFQKSYGISVNGVVGVQTRSALNALGCSTNPINPPSPIFPAYQPLPPVNTGCSTYSSWNCPSGISLRSLTPNAGAVGQYVTVSGSGFSLTGNTIHFGSGIIANVNSQDGFTVSFTVPSQLVGFGSSVVSLGTYPVSVTNQRGETSNSLSFTVTSLGAYSAPTITTVTGPTALSAGQQGTWTMQVNPFGNQLTTVSVSWGDEAIYSGAAQTTPQYLSAYNQQMLSFTHTYNTPGTYTVRFTATGQSGLSNTTTTTVTVTSGGTQGYLSISSLSPASGRIGTQIAIQGSGFSAWNNTVHFGNGGAANVPSSNNGTLIYYTVPSTTSACDFAGYGCYAPTQYVSPGTYPVYVSSASGSSNTQNFSVTQ